MLSMTKYFDLLDHEPEQICREILQCQSTGEGGKRQGLTRNL